MRRPFRGILLATFVPCLCASAATVRGKLLQTVANRQIPAGGVSVTLLDGQNKRSFAVQSDASGMYFFQNVSPGNYTLQIWRKPGGPPIPYPIRVTGATMK